MTSLPSQTIVPTDVALGLLIAIGATGVKEAVMVPSLSDKVQSSLDNVKVFQLIWKRLASVAR